MVTVDDLSLFPLKDGKMEHSMEWFRGQRQEKWDEGKDSICGNKSGAEDRWLACLSGIAREHEVSMK